MDLNRKVINDFQYYIRDKIGRGSSSEVFKGLNQKTKQQVAIKVISLQQELREGHLEVAYAEIDVLKKLKGHKNIVQLKNAIETKNNVYIITQLCQKGTLQYEIGRGGKMDQARAVKIIEDVIQGYKFISAQGVIHRDLKPSNIFQKDKIYKIGDFGYAIETQQRQVAKKENVGSPLFMSPQSLSQNHYSFQSDIWALGIIYYILLTGKSPWKARSQRQLIVEHKHFMIQKVLPKNIGGLSRTFLQKTLQKNAEERMGLQQLNRWRFNETPKNVLSSMSSLNSILQKPTLKNVRSITTIQTARNNIHLTNIKSTSFLPTIIQNQPHDFPKVSQLNKQKIKLAVDRTNYTSNTISDMSLQFEDKPQNKNRDGDGVNISIFKSNSSINILKHKNTVANFASRPSLQTIISNQKSPKLNDDSLVKQKQPNMTIHVISPPKYISGLCSPKESLNIASFQDRERSLTQINDKQLNILTQIQAQINYFRYLFRILRKICECLKTNQAKLDEFKNNLLSCIYSKIAEIKQLKHIKGCTNQQKEVFLKSRQYLNILNILLQYRQKIEQEARKHELKIVFVTQRGFINNLSYVINIIYSNILQIKSNINVLDKKKALIFILEDLISLSDLFLLCCEQHWSNFRDRCDINNHLTKEYPLSIDSKYLQKVETRFFELGKA